MNIITGYRGEPHITAQEDRDINLGVIGKSTTDLYVLDVGQKLDADIVSANEVRIRDGVLIMQGCAASIDYGTYDSLTISNGSQGMERIDVIAAQYERDGDTNVESVSLVVIEGTPAASDPAVPSLTSGSIHGGDSLVQMPLYYVNLDGVSIDSVEEQFIFVDSAFSNSITEATKTKWSTITQGNGSIDDALDYLADNKITVEDDTITTGNNNINNWYYANKTISTDNLISVFVYDTTSNRPAMVQMVGTNTIRAYSTAASTTVKFRMVRKKI